MRTRPFLPLSICLWISCTAFAADAIDPYVESTTMLLGKIDLKRIDPPAVFQFLQSQVPAEQAAPLLTARAMAVAYVQALRDAQVDSVYVTLSTIDCLTGNLAVLIPCPEPEKIAPLLDVFVPRLPKYLKLSIHRAPGIIAIASDQTWSRLAAKPTAIRPDLLAVDLAGAAPAVTLTISLPEKLRNEVAEIWPDRLPPQIPFEASPKSMMADARSSTIYLDPPPSLQVRLRVQTTDAVAAERVRATLVKAVKLVPGIAPQVVVEQANVTVNISAQEVQQFLATLVQPIRSASFQSQDSNSLKHIILAMHNFHDKYQYFPPRATLAPEGKQLLSWRVFLLPYLDEVALYKQFHLDEPWDSPHNRPLSDKMPAVYRVSTYENLPAGHTCYQMPLMPGSAWFGDGLPKSLRDITDGTSNTIAVVVAPRDKSVIWTKPDDLTIRPENIVNDLLAERDSLSVVYFDGSVRPLTRDVKPITLKAVITSAGGEVP